MGRTAVVPFVLGALMAGIPLGLVTVVAIDAEPAPAVAVASSAPTTTAPTTTAPVDPPLLPAVGGCAIRLYPDGPRIHANVAHTCRGIADVAVDEAGRLRLAFTRPGPSVAFTVGTDETLTGRGITAGVDVDESGADITLYDTTLGRTLHLGQPADYARAGGTYTNLWVTMIRLAESSRQSPVGQRTDRPVTHFGCHIVAGAAIGSVVRDDMCTGIESVGIDERGWVELRPAVSLPVVAIATTPDGDATARGLRVGGSGGVNAVYVPFYDPGLGRTLDLRVPADLARLGDRAGFHIALRQDRTGVAAPHPGVLAGGSLPLRPIA